MNFTFPENASHELQVALTAAVEAANISRSQFRKNFKVTFKNDNTPVTEVDIQCERRIREIISDSFPNHGIFGEESGLMKKDSNFLWLVDPIDGTKSFVREYPFFSTQIALLHKDEIILGVSSGTMFDEMVWAERGKKSWFNGKETRVSAIDDLSKSTLSVGNIASLAGSKGWENLGKIVTLVDRIRGYGDFYHYHLLVSGKIDAVIESDVNILDIAALSIIVEEAGGVFTDLNGDKPNLETRSVLASNQILHKQILDQLKGFIS